MTIRVMLVDDAVVVRHVLSDALSADPDIEVVGTAADGLIAMEKLPKFDPDLVVLDVEMPNMDGIETLAAIRKQYPHIRVVMFSTLTSNGAGATMDAMMLGADDYSTKPSNTGSMASAVEVIKSDLIPKIKALCSSSVRTVASPVVTPVKPALPDRFLRAAPNAQVKEETATEVVRPRSVASGAPKILAIAVSTGGPNALAELLPSLPKNLPVPVVIVQHIPAMFSKALADRLNTKSQVTVNEGIDGAELRPGEVWLAPGDFHMTVKREGTGVFLHLNQGPQENSCRPAADVLFRSVAETYGSNALGLVLTGMGYDGLKGSKALVAAGSHVIAQDEATSVVWGMPGAVVHEGVAEQAFPLNALAREIVGRTMGAQAAH